MSDLAEINEWDLYVPGVTEFNPEPGTCEVRDMLYLVAYDVTDPRRLRKVAKICEDYGVRVEKSVFECDLPPEVFDQLWCRLIDTAAEDEDAVVAYRICKSCLKEVESIGVVARPKARLLYCL
ncbi:MAG: CRISPR-associated endonuclease Cas2 [Lentisphaeria bacterium]|nr:CRISPR-associated endonuclease Cas2 [Lentisphaeria bacterium]